MPNHAILTADAHRNLKVRSDRAGDAGDAVMCAMVVPDEFRQVQNEYPILFRRNLEQDSFAAFAMFGFENGENLPFPIYLLLHFYIEGQITDRQLADLRGKIRE